MPSSSSPSGEMKVKANQEKFFLAKNFKANFRQATNLRLFQRTCARKKVVLT